MTPVDYNIFYKRALPIAGDWSGAQWDVFISAYNSSERVKIVYDKVDATRKYWVVHREYEFLPIDLPKGAKVDATSDEASSIINLVDIIESDLGRPLEQLRVCVDLTGFMRPHILFLALFFHRKNIKAFDVIYTEPARYLKKEKTTFSEGAIQVRQVAGFRGVNSPEQSDDLLIIGSGYDYRLIKSVAEYKDKADKVQLFGLPSLRADFYQESVLNANRAADAIGINKSTDQTSFFAPANDPFATASAISEVVTRRRRLKPITNLYLSPLSTKAQALGFALYYIGECINQTASLIFPVSTKYARETSQGLSRVWICRIEYPLN